MPSTREWVKIRTPPRRAPSARVITAAALIMVCVFSAFVFGNSRELKVFGLGLATAVLGIRRWHPEPAWPTRKLRYPDRARRSSGAT